MHCITLNDLRGNRYLILAFFSFKSFRFNACLLANGVESTRRSKWATSGTFFTASKTPERCSTISNIQVKNSLLHFFLFSRGHILGPTSYSWVVFLVNVNLFEFKLTVTGHLYGLFVKRFSFEWNLVSYNLTSLSHPIMSQQHNQSLTHFHNCQNRKISFSINLFFTDRVWKTKKADSLSTLCGHTSNFISDSKLNNNNQCKVTKNLWIQI